MKDYHSIFSMLVAVTTICVLLNDQCLKLPKAVGLTLSSILIATLVSIFSSILPRLVVPLTSLLSAVDFKSTVLSLMLGYLLFAGSLHADFRSLRKELLPILYLASLGVILSTFFSAIGLYYVSNWLNLKTGLNICILFAALISPTDPIAVISIFKTSSILPEKIKSRLVGEALFNDAIGILLLISLQQFISPQIANPSGGKVALHFSFQIIGACALSFMLGSITLKMLNLTKSMEGAVLLTVTTSGLGYSIADYLHLSGPITMVISGLYISYQLTRQKNSALPLISSFWGIVDAILNAFIFVLIGLETLTIDFNLRSILLGSLAFLIISLARFISIIILDKFHLLCFKRYKFEFKENLFLSWGGIRGGVSLALALAIATISPQIVPITYVAVVLSIIVQGLSFPWIIRKLS